MAWPAKQNQENGQTDGALLTAAAVNGGTVATPLLPVSRRTPAKANDPQSVYREIQTVTAGAPQCQLECPLPPIVCVALVMQLQAHQVWVV